MYPYSKWFLTEAIEGHKVQNNKQIQGGLMNPSLKSCIIPCLLEPRIITLGEWNAIQHFY